MGPPYLDASVLTGLAGDLGTDQIVDLCGVFLAEAGDRVVAVGRAWTAGDTEATARGAHRLKSSCAFVGAGALCRLCGEIEQLARAGCLAEVGARVASMSGALERTRGEVAALLMTWSAEAGSGPAGP